MEYFDKDWKKNQTFLKLTTVDFAQYKNYDDLNGTNKQNYANNTDSALGK